MWVNAGGLEYRAVNTYPFHDRAVTGEYFNGTPGTTPYSTGHKFFNRDLTGEVKITGQFTDGL